MQNDPDALIGTVRHPYSAVDIDVRKETIAIERAVYQLGQAFEPDIIRISLPNDIRNKELAGFLLSAEFLDLVHEIDTDLEAVIDGSSAAHRMSATLEVDLHSKKDREK
ncbi:hypothetical protein [Brucella tritici]|uniref:Uncharacterized protein n=1 Tax=Brucella tritici TaxID=94626 RepID=A0A6L3YE36_9HYPH|nr:hypothetical protein [Brucella tritici]KAB2680050.1 hypothetical protein F9L08_21875 [Brucella tritici]